MSIAVSSEAHARVGVVPVLRYRDVEEALSWLARAFGFEESRFVKDGEGKARYAQVSWGDGMIMLCPLGGSAFDACMAQPGETGGCETQICYVYVADVEAHKARAIEAGAEIVLDMVAGDGRGQGYSCRDLEGHIWSFGTYDPWRHVRADAVVPAPVSGVRRAMTTGVLAAALAAALAAGYVHLSGATGSGSAAALASIESVLEKPTDLASAERLLRQAREELMRERSARMMAERQGLEQKDAVTREREARAGSEKALGEARKTIIENTEKFDKAKAETDRAIKTAQRPDAATAFPVPPVPGQPIAIKACETEADARTIRTASLAINQSDEVSALRTAMERAQAELNQERQSRSLRANTASELRGQLDRERAGRERAERQVRDALARLARLDPQRRPEPAPPREEPYKDLNRVVFPLSINPR